MTATLCLSFDNLGEAAEIGAGARDPAIPPGDHHTATVAVPAILDELAKRGLPATFFVEGLNAELYPDLLRRIDSQGHEVAYHAWTHEQWGDLALPEQIDNLARGVDAFERIGLSLSGMRPPGGALGAGGIEIVRDAGLRYCSPAGQGAGTEGGVAILGFQWLHVDASCVLPSLGAVREKMAGTDGPVEPTAFLTHLEREIAQLSAAGGYATIVLHPFMLDWLGEARLQALLDRLAGPVYAGDLWVATCRDLAAEVLTDPDSFQGGATLDPTGWSG